jgi:2-oxoglutarate ferredoxin oxidoreductase subunit delta
VSPRGQRPEKSPARPGKKAPAPAPTAEPGDSAAEQRVSFYPAWCKRCGNCVAFCPRQALGHDEWGHPRLAHPERCTACGLCEMLCPDFAISVSGTGPAAGEAAAAPAASGQAAPTTSPERLAPEPAGEDNGEHSDKGQGGGRG